MHLQDKRKAMGLPIKLIISGVVICASGVALGWGILPKLVENQVAQVSLVNKAFGPTIVLINIAGKKSCPRIGWPQIMGKASLPSCFQNACFQRD